jgi:hypothetical protein
MDEFEGGWREFPLGLRVEVRTIDDIWRRGTVIETPLENERMIVVKCDEKYHDNLDFHEGCGAGVMVYTQTRRDILSMIRAIDEPKREVIIPRREPVKLEGTSAEILRIAELAVQHSNGLLRLAYNEEDEGDEFTGGAQRFLKLDGKRLGRDLELYGFMANIAGWERILVEFLLEVILPLKKASPESYAKAGEALRLLGESVYQSDKLEEWNNLF